MAADVFSIFYLVARRMVAKEGGRRKGEREEEGREGKGDIVDRDCLRGINWNRLRCRVMPFIVICSIPTTPVCLAASLDAIHCRLLSNLHAEYADRSV